MKKNGIPKTVLSKLEFGTDIDIASSYNGYITCEILCNYIRKYYHDAKLIVSNKCTAHTSSVLKEVLKERAIEQIFIPSGCTKFIQPLDVSVFRSFKAKLDTEKNKYLEESYENRTKAGNIKIPIDRPL